jgi:hypothetical protein
MDYDENDEQDVQLATCVDRSDLFNRNPTAAIIFLHGPGSAISFTKIPTLKMFASM